MKTCEEDLMRFLLLSSFFIMFLEGCSCGEKKSDNVSASRAAVSTDTVENGASFTVTFTSTWDSSTHPSDSFPSDPHFSQVVGTTHNNSYSMWKPGEKASAGMKQLAELGGVITINSEIQSAIDAGNALRAILADGTDSPGTVTIEIATTQEYPRLSLATMIAPSPDWIVGLYDVILFDGTDWIDETTVELFAYDVGTDSGTSYSSANSVTDPVENISKLDASPFQTGVRLGTMKIVQTSTGT